jgi:glyoxylase-like metal-dependent hydrolase (beta-lactamase superfamily II)
MTGFVAMPGSMGPWHGGRYRGAECVLAGNPGPLTLDGTNTWLLAADADSVVIVDPGPDDPGHLVAVRRALAGRWVRDILLTHGHADHSAGARLFADTLRARVRALDPAHCYGDEGLAPGSVLESADLEIRVVATPGHTADSVSLHLPHRGALLTGDTILGRGTTVVAHPDGRLADYLESLRRLSDLVDAAGATQVWPGHGPVLGDAAAVLAAYLEHRQQRLDEVARALAEFDPELTVDDVAPLVVQQVYADVPRVLWPAAELSVRAQLQYLRQGR